MEAVQVPLGAPVQVQHSIDVDELVWCLWKLDAPKVARMLM